MSQPLLFDVYCGAGGAGRGYHRAGFRVIGIDIAPQPRYPYPFVQGDALEFLRKHGKHADVLHASPPCQAFTLAQRIQGRQHPDLIAATRDLLESADVPYVIENVVGAPLRDPITLCGAMFPGLRVYRHREFESNVELTTPAHPEHVAPLRKMGRPPQPGEFMHVVGNFSGAAQAREAMGIDWMTRDELREAIPPAYTDHVGRQLVAVLAQETAA
jgi:DNA (cytosine-5)-methyltransferase 1